VSGQLMGVLIHRQDGKFASLYFRDVAKDFNVLPAQVPEYCMVSGYAQMANQNGKQMASGMLYIGERNSGKVMGYSFPWTEKGRGEPIPLTSIDVFQWRQPANLKPGQ
jgi:hypothetical protein